MLLRSLGLSALLLILCRPICRPVSAQVIADDTAGTEVNGTGSLTITGGSLQSTTLFHSFSDFSPNTSDVTFTLDGLQSSIETVISRVTGGNASFIDGQLALTGGSSPDLFLINPNGITFGTNASLALPGSFIASTAGSVLFEDKLEFIARNSNDVPLLTVSTPIGLQFDGAASSIQVLGNGNDSIVPDTNLGLTSAPGKTIAFVGGDVTFSGGVATALAGRVEVGAVETGTVSLAPIAPLAPVSTGWQLGYDQVQTFSDVDLNNRSSLWNPDPLGNLLGGIQVVGRDINLNQSQIAAATAGSQQGGSITVNAQRSLTMGGVHPAAAAPSAWIVNQVALGASGNGGGINVQTEQIRLQDGAAIETFSLGSGRSGDIHVDTGKTGALFVKGTVPVVSPLLPAGTSESRISTTAYASGDSGNIDVTSGQVMLYNSGRIRTLSQVGAVGDGGNVSVTADDIHSEGTDIDSIAPSGILTTALGSGDGGDITIETDTLSLIDGGEVFAYVSGLAGIPGTGIGQAGDVTVSATQRMEISGTSPIYPTLISFLGSSTAGEGDAGNVTVTTPTLSLGEGAFLGSTTLPVVGAFGDIALADQLGDSGDVRINVSDQLSISGVHPFTRAITVLGSASFGSGNLGNVEVQSSRLVLQNGGSIGTLTAANGNAGSLNVSADDILIEGVQGLPSSISASAPVLDPTTRLFYDLPDVPSGDTGELAITAKRLTIRDGGTVSVQHEGTGNAGQLAIQVGQTHLKSAAQSSTAIGL